MLRSEQDNIPARLAYNPDEAALLLGVSRDLVYDLLHRRELRSVKAGAKRLVSAAAIHEFLADPLAIEALVRSRLAFSREEAATVMGISADTVDKLIRAGELKARKFGRCVMIGRAAIEAYLMEDGKS